jgi:glycosyltransferase involved in cell wall biosynthesis
MNRSADALRFDPQVAVIMPVYNGSKYIQAAIGSLVRQASQVNLRLVIIDDGSTDETPDLLRKAANSHTFISVITQPNCGYTAALNSGLQNIPESADLVSFLDSDDISSPGRFLRDIAYFRDQPGLDLVYGLVHRFEHDEEVESIPVNAGQRIISLGAGIYKRRLISDIGLFDLDFEQGCDGDYLFRIFEQPRNWIFLDTTALYYRQHPGSMTSDRAAMRRGYFLAYHKAVKRKKANPKLVSLPAEFGSFGRQD